VQLRPAVDGLRVRPVRLEVRLALAAVEDVVGRVVDERRAERGDVRRAADVDRGRALRIVLGAVDVGPGAACRTSVGRSTSRAAASHVPVGAGQRDDVLVRELLASARPSWPPAPVIRSARAASRVGEDRRVRAPEVLHARVGPADAVLVGSAGSYSSVTW
jgi:hypothetical protein